MALLFLMVTRFATPCRSIGRSYARVWMRIVEAIEKLTSEKPEEDEKRSRADAEEDSVSWPNLLFSRAIIAFESGTC